MADFRAGQICAAVRDGLTPRKDGQAWEPGDFFRSLRPEELDEEPILLEDPEAHSDLILSAFGFGKP